MCFLELSERRGNLPESPRRHNDTKGHEELLYQQKAFRNKGQLLKSDLKITFEGQDLIKHSIIVRESMVFLFLPAVGFHNAQEQIKGPTAGSGK